MKRIYALLFNLSLITTCSVAKSNKIATKYQHNKNSKTIHNKSHKNNNYRVVQYKLKVGDTLLAIAKKYHTTVSKIVRINRLDRSKRLKVGTVLKVSTNIYKLSHSSNTNTKKMHRNANCFPYKVKKGDRLITIAKRAKTTVAKIEKVNTFSAKNTKLRLGEIIFIPKVKIAKQESNGVTKILNKITNLSKVKEPIRTKKNFHIIKKGDTLYNLASKNHTTVAKIKKLNRITKSNSLKLGEKILLTENIAVNKKSVNSSLQHAKKKMKIAKNTKMKTPKIVLKKSKKLASFSDSTVRFSKQRLKNQTTNNDNTNLWSLDNSSVKLSVAKRHLGKRYVWGAMGPKSFDCSGFTKYVCKKSGISLPRTSINQSKVGKRVARGNLKAGDLIFFDTSKRRKGYVNHVGIYIGNNKFIHASSGKRRVVITNLNKPFYRARFKWGSRVDS